jgi:hypothetical protein
MGNVLTDLSFDEWVRHYFDHPVTDPAWHWADAADAANAADRAELAPRQVVAHAARLFREAEEQLAQYSEAQANQGLSLLIQEGDSPLYTLGETTVPLAERLHCIYSIATLFEKYLAPRCAPRLGGTGGDLNPVCYMWWDLFPLYGQPENPLRREIDNACLWVMEASLALPSLACQQSALHGLGHWRMYYPDRCQTLISEFLAGHLRLHTELREYALCALEGRVL